MNLTPEEIILEHPEKPVIKLKKPGSKEPENKEPENKERVIAELPKDDTYVILNKYATYLKLNNWQRKKIIAEREAAGKSTQGYEKLDKKEPKPVRVNGNEYEIEEIVSELNGFQAIVFKEKVSGKLIISVAGSYGITQFFWNPWEWTMDWIVNNFAMGFNIMPLQLKSLKKLMEKYNKEDTAKDENKENKETKENRPTTEMVGYSLGAILAGLYAIDDPKVKAFMYNGGVLRKLAEKMGIHIADEDSYSNLITMTSDDEFLTNLASIVYGNGIYAVTSNTESSSHKLENLDGRGVEDYILIATQTGMGFADTLAGYTKATENGGLEMGISMSPTLGNKKVPYDPDVPKPIKEVSYIKRLPKNKSKKFKPLTQIKPLNNKPQEIPTGGAAPIETEIECRNDYERELAKKLWAEFDEDYLEDLEKSIQNIARINPNSTLIPRFEKSHKIRRRKYVEQGLAQARMQAARRARAIQLRNVRPQKSRAEMAAEFEEYFRNVLDDFIIRMGFEMHDYT